MSIKDIILAGGQALQLYSTTYTANGTATWPSGATLMLHGIGGPRSGTQNGWTAAQYPTGTQAWGGKYSGLSYEYNFAPTQSGFPQNVDMVGTGLNGSTFNVSWPGGTVPEANGGPSLYIDAFSLTFTINNVSTSPFPQAAYQGNLNLYSGGAAIVLTTYSGGAPAGGLAAYYPTPTYSYSDGTQASLVVNGVTKTFAGQTAAGASNYTDYTVSAGATTSGSVVVPAGGSVTVSYYA